MSFLRAKVDRTNLSPVEQPSRVCDECKKESEVKGGVALNSKKWICQKCWSKRMKGR